MHPACAVSYHSLRRNRYRGSGTTIVEVVIACVLLSVALVSVGTLQTQVTRAQKSLDQRAQLRSALLNARELIGSWPPAQVSALRIQAIPIEPSALDWPPGLRWEVDVARATEPWSGQAVFLDLVWEETGKRHSAGGLTFWVHDPLAADPAAPRASTRLETEQP